MGRVINELLRSWRPPLLDANRATFLRSPRLRESFCSGSTAGTSPNAGSVSIALLLVLLTVDFADAKVSLDKSPLSASSTAIAGLGIAGRLVAREVFLVGFGRLVLLMPIRIGDCGGEGCTRFAGQKCLD